jgi:hypothetical protein
VLTGDNGESENVRRVAISPAWIQNSYQYAWTEEIKLALNAGMNLVPLACGS